MDQRKRDRIAASKRDKSGNLSEGSKSSGGGGGGDLSPFHPEFRRARAEGACKCDVCTVRGSPKITRLMEVA